MNNINSCCLYVKMVSGVCFFNMFFEWEKSFRLSHVHTPVCDCQWCLASQRSAYISRIWLMAWPKAISLTYYVLCLARMLVYSASHKVNEMVAYQKPWQNAINNFLNVVLKLCYSLISNITWHWNWMLLVLAHSCMSWYGIIGTRSASPCRASSGRGSMYSYEKLGESLCMTIFVL